MNKGVPLFYLKKIHCVLRLQGAGQLSRLNGLLACVIVMATALTPLSARAAAPPTPATPVMVAPTDQPAASDKNYRISKIPDWVVMHALPPVTDTTRGESIRYLLSDYQYRIAAAPEQSSYFVHLIDQPMSEEALKNMGQIPLSFNPSFETVQLHRLNLLRAGKALDKLNSAMIKVVQDEKQLQMGMYEGSSTLMIVIDDLRVGDIIDVAYTIVGRNPVFGTREFSTLRLQYNRPIEQSEARLLMPATRSINSKAFNGAPAAKKSTHDGLADWRWSGKAVAGVPEEDYTPGWYDPEMRVQLSEYNDWASVNAWAMELFQAPESLSPALKAQIAQWQSGSKNSEEAAIKALRFVQDEVRYFGIEVGENSHRPHAPNDTFDLRYGDCKDKTFLLVTILKSMGIEASPALVISTGGRKLTELLPTPGAFNHVIVWARINGFERWLDPTITLQRGDATHLAFVDYQQALLVKAGTTALTAMRSDGQLSPSVRIKNRIEYAKDGGATLVVQTAASAGEADRLRSALASYSKDEFKRQQLNFIQSRYQGASNPDDLIVDDDQTNNLLNMTEKYRLDHFVKQQASGDVVEIYAAQLGEWVRLPRTLERRAPLQQYSPFTLDETIELVLPPGQAFTLGPNQQLTGKAVVYQREGSLENGVVRYQHHLQFTNDFVAPADTAEYFGVLRSIQNNAGMTLTLPSVQRNDRESRLKALLRGNGGTH